AGLSFSSDGTKLYFGVGHPPEPEKDPNKDTPAEEKVVVDLWHWKDDFIQPMQKVRSQQERNRSYRVVAFLNDKKVRQLADETMQDVFAPDRGETVLGADDRAYRILVGFDTNYADYYLVNLADGSRKPILKKHQGTVTWSPEGNAVLFYDGT